MKNIYVLPLVAVFLAGCASFTTEKQAVLEDGGVRALASVDKLLGDANEVKEMTIACEGVQIYDGYVDAKNGAAGVVVMRPPFLGVLEVEGLRTPFLCFVSSESGSRADLVSTCFVPGARSDSPSYQVSWNSSASGANQVRYLPGMPPHLSKLTGTNKCTSVKFRPRGFNSP